MIDPRRKDWTEKDWAKYDLLMKKAWDDVFEEWEALRDNEEGETQMTWRDKIDEETRTLKRYFRMSEKTEKAPCACQDTSDSEDVTNLAWLEAAKDSSTYGVKFLEELSKKKKGEKEAMNVHEKNLERIEKFLGSNEDGIRDTWYNAERKKHREMMEKSGLLQDISSEDVMVHHPPHYERNGNECIDWIEMALTPEEFKGYLKGCAYKYQWRHEEKGHRERDLQKAQWYLRKLESLGEK